MKSPYAGFGPRVLAFALDYLVILVYLSALAALSLAAGNVFPAATSRLFETVLSSQLTGFVTLTLPVILYFSLLESSAWQATWGKRRRHLKVTGMNGERLRLGRAVFRTMLKLIPWELAHTCVWQVRFAPQEPSPLVAYGFILVWLLAGFYAISLLVSPTHQALYDLLAGTCVVFAER